MEVILMIGISGSGKTTLSKIAFPDHTHISLDVLKTISPIEKINILARHKDLSCCTGLSNNRKRECVLLHEALNACKNIVIDDTNLTKDIRARHISTAHEYGGVVRAVHFTNASQAFDYNRKRMRRLDDSVLYGQRDKKSMAYKTLGLGVGITMLFLVPMLAASTFETEPVAQYTDEEIKGQAVTIPYESLINQSEIHTGEIVRYEGTLVQVKKQSFDEYILRVGITQERFTATDIILLNYKPVTEGEKDWLDRAENELPPFMTDGRETIAFWGISKGLAEYTTTFDQKVTIPEIDVIILERHAQDASSELDTTHVDPEPQEILTTSEYASNIHTMSYDDVPVYADEPTVERAISDATRVWDMANTNVDFTIVESDADVNIQWARYMPGSALGLHSARVTDDGTRERHSITVRLGIDDCHSTYQPFTHKTIQYIVAHEIGHYLGLRHVDDKTHLMHSGDFFNVDSIRVYDDRNFGIPHVERPDISTVAGMRVQAEIDMLNDDLKQVSVQRQSLKNTADTEALDINTNTYNGLVQRIQDLEDQLACVDIT